MKITINGCIRRSDYAWMQEPAYDFVKIYADDEPPSDTEETVMIQRHVLEVEIPENFDGTAQKIAALQKKMANIEAQARKELMKAQEQISKLQALTYEGA